MCMLSPVRKRHPYDMETPQHHVFVVAGIEVRALLRAEAHQKHSTAQHSLEKQKTFTVLSPPFNRPNAMVWHNTDDNYIADGD